MLLSKVFVKCMKKYYSKYTNMNIAKYQDLFLLFKLQAITFTKYQCLNIVVSGEKFNILLTNNYVSFEQLGPESYYPTNRRQYSTFTSGPRVNICQQ